MPGKERSGMASVPNTDEYMQRCMCGRCPSYPGDVGLYCARGKSATRGESRGLHLHRLRELQGVRPLQGLLLRGGLRRADRGLTRRTPAAGSAASSSRSNSSSGPGPACAWGRRAACSGPMSTSPAASSSSSGRSSRTLAASRSCRQGARPACGSRTTAAGTSAAG